MSNYKGIANILLDLLFPQKPYCVLCGAKLKTSENCVCEECEKAIVPISNLLCGKCGKPLAVYAMSNSQGFLCNDCKKQSHYFQKARAFGNYEGALKELIHQFKYRGRRSLGDFLSQKMIVSLEKLPWPVFDYIVPVPLHIKRQQERGFNQAYLLAKGLSQKNGVPVLNALMRIKPTEHQTLLDKDLRRQNLKGAFKVVEKSHIHRKKLLLIDDVYTTGATVDACAKILMEVGAKAVFVYTCARG